MRKILATAFVFSLLFSVAAANPYGRNYRGSYGGYQNGYGRGGWYGQGGTQINVFPQAGNWIGPGQLNYYQGGYGNYWPQQGPPRAYYRQQYKLNTSPGWDW